MTNTRDNLQVVSFYRFISINNKEEFKKTLESFLKKKIMRGTILISDEGINGSISGTEKDLNRCFKFLKNYLGIKNINPKINKTDYLPFNKLKIRLKKEIVSLGIGEINVEKFRGKFVKPENWNEIINDDNIKLVDVRNTYEIEVGKFKNSLNPKTNNFREFPYSLKKMQLKRNDKIALYCTGGIRCEKASSFLKSKGYKNILQLKGGILKYLEYIEKNKKKSFWNGECFVFDERVTINKRLQKGGYSQCYGCRRPIQKKDMNSIYYKKGIHCPNCYNSRTKDQIKSSEDRQKQIDYAIENNLENTFIKVNNLTIYKS